MWVVDVARMVVVKGRECGGRNYRLLDRSDDNLIVVSGDRFGGSYNNRVAVQGCGDSVSVLLRLLWQVVTKSTVSIFICNIVDRILTAIWSNVRVGSLNHVLVRSLDTVFQSTDSVGGLESGKDENVTRSDDLLYWPEKFWRNFSDVNWIGIILAE